MPRLVKNAFSRSSRGTTCEVGPPCTQTMYGGSSPSGARTAGLARRVDQRVHLRAGRAGQPVGPRHRQVGGVGQLVGAAGAARGPRRVRGSRRPRRDVHADHGHRHRRAARDRGDALAGRRQPGREHPVRQVEVGQLTGVRVEHSQPGGPGAVGDGEAAVAEHRVRARAQLPQRGGELLRRAGTAPWPSRPGRPGTGSTSPTGPRSRTGCWSSRHAGASTDSAGPPMTTCCVPSPPTAATRSSVPSHGISG